MGVNGLFIGVLMDCFSPVEVGRWFVQSEDTAVDTEGVGEGEADDEGGEDLSCNGVYLGCI